MPNRGRAPRRYHLKCNVAVDADFLDEVRVCGSCVELGSMDPAKALEMTLIKDSTKLVWSTVRPVILEQPEIEYKYAIYHAGKFVRWEEIEGTRSLAMTRKFPPPLRSRTSLLLLVPAGSR